MINFLFARVTDLCSNNLGYEDINWVNPKSYAFSNNVGIKIQVVLYWERVNFQPILSLLLLMFQWICIYSFSMQLVSLTLDGVTGAVQERMRSDHKTGANSMMFNINVWSILWSAIGMSHLFCFVFLALSKVQKINQ